MSQPKNHVTSGLRPAAQQVVIDPGLRHQGIVMTELLAQALNGHIQIKQQRALCIIANHALYPEEGTDARPSSHGCHTMQAGSRVQNHGPGLQQRLHLL